MAKEAFILQIPPRPFLLCAKNFSARSAIYVFIHEWKYLAKYSVQAQDIIASKKNQLSHIFAVSVANASSDFK